MENARRAVEAQKIEGYETTHEIKEWNAGVEAKVEQADEKLEVLEEWLHDQKLKQETHEREEQMQFEIKLHENQTQASRRTRAAEECSQRHTQHTS